MIDRSQLRWLNARGLEALDAEIFPAANHEAVTLHRTVHATAAVDQTGAICFYHHHLQAINSCAQCGCYVCAMCAVPINGYILCPQCVTHHHSHKHASQLTRLSHPAWDTRALGLVILGMLPMFWFILTPLSIATLIIIGTCWNKPTSLVRPQKSRFIVAGLMALFGLPAGIFFWLSVLNF